MYKLCLTDEEEWGEDGGWGEDGHGEGGGGRGFRGRGGWRGPRGRGMRRPGFGFGRGFGPPGRGFGPPGNKHKNELTILIYLCRTLPSISKRTWLWTERPTSRLGPKLGTSHGRTGRAGGTRRARRTWRTLGTGTWSNGTWRTWRSRRLGTA